MVGFYEETKDEKVEAISAEAKDMIR